MSEQPASAIWTTRPATSSGSAVVPQSNGMKMPMPPPPEPKKKLAFPSTVGVRQEMRTFFYPTFEEPAVQTAALQRRDLFILAFMRWKSLPKEDIDSYVQIAGVHGRPMSIGYGVDAPLTETELVAAATVEGTPRAFVTPLTKLKYNDRPGPGDGEVQFSNMGVAEFAYCKHGRPTFMTWHRPFMYLAERAIRKCAKYLVENGLIRGDLNAAKKQVELIRIPYWNWCIDAPVPDVLLADTIALTQFAMDGQGTSGVSSDLIEGHMSDPNITGRPHESIVPNPFKSFNPTAQQFEYFNGEVPGPEKFNQPQGIPGTLTDYDSNCVFGPDGTLRQPGWSNYLANHLVKTLRKNVGMGCMYKDFIAPNGDVQQSSSHWFEAAHNALHNVFSMAIAPDHGRPTAQRSPWTKTGTNPGVVTVMGRSAMLNDCSTFDPAFFFHHCFVDCQLSMQRAAYPAGEFIPQIKNPEKNKKDPNTSYYPDVDPVPTDDKDLRKEFGQNRQWLTSAFHPWSTGLFSELFGGDDLSRERQKLQQQADAKAAAKDNGQPIPDDTYVPQYVDSADTEHCEQWGVTYQMLLTEKAQRSGDVELSFKDRSAWMMSAKEAQAKFIFDFTEDPFLRLVHELSRDLGTNFPWPTEDIPPKQLRRLIEAATPMTWTLNMKLPKFFKVADGFAVGRSWTLNVYWWDKSSTLPVSRDARLSTVTPRDPSFAGSASVFAPFDLRACLNCQADNMVLPVSVDLTDIIVRRNATHLSDDEILAQIDLQAVGVPADMLPPYNTWRDYFKATLVKRPAMTVEGLEKGSVPQVLLTWKNELAKLVKTNPPKSNSISDVSPTTSMLTQLQQIWSTFQSSHPNELQQVVSLLGHRTKPIHEFRIAATGTGAGIGIGIGDNTNKSAKRVNESKEEDGQGPAKKSKKSH